MVRSSIAGISVAVFLATLQGADIPTAQYDSNRTSWNSSETYLNTSNVNPQLFGKLFTRALDGWVYAQPLYLRNLAIPGYGTRNVVFVCTANNTVYAFDADSAAITAPYWSTNLGAPDTTPSTPTSPNSEPSLGIISTPVIVRGSGTLYVTAATRENGHRVYRLHALNIATGQEMAHSPVVIAGQVAGTAPDAQNGVLTFNPDFHLQRAGLAVAGGSVYVATAGSRDIEPFHGWVFGYDLTTLAQTSVLNLTAGGMAGGVWQSTRAPVVDSSGNLYLETGNGDYDGAANFSNSVVRLNSTSQGLTVADWFTPDNWQYLTDNDLDLSSAGPLLVPGTNSLVAAGKAGTVYVLNSTNLGRLQTGNGQIPQLLQVTAPCVAVTCDYTNDPIFWNNAGSPMLYVWPWNDVLRALSWTGSQLSPTPASINSLVSNYPGGQLAGSSNGSVAGTGIVWALTGDSESTQAATLRAYDASNVANQLWTSDMNASRDAAGLFAKNLPPLVANGKVYVGNFSNQLIVYGLLSNATLAVSPTSSAAFSYTLGGSTTVQNTTITVSSAPAGLPLSISTAGCGSWLQTATQTGVTTPIQLTIGVSGIGFTSTQTCNIVFSASGGPGFTFPVTMNVAPQPALTVVTSPVSASYVIGSPTTTAVLTSSVTGSTPIAGLTTGAPTPNTGTTLCGWITSSSIGATTPATIAINTTFAGLAAGTYSCTVPVSGIGTPPGGTPAFPSAPTVANGIVVNATITPQPSITVNGLTTPAPLSFIGLYNSAQPVSQILNIGGVTNLNVTATATNSAIQWLTAVAAGSSTGYSLTVSANSTGLAPSTYTGTITLSGQSAASVTIPVTLTVEVPAFSKTNIGVYRSSNGLFIENASGTGVQEPDVPGGDNIFALGNFTPLSTDIAVTGDWNGSGFTKVGFYRPTTGTWFLDYNGDGVFNPAQDKQYQFGGVQAGAACPGGDLPVTGDWTGSGYTKIGIFRCGFLWILDENGNGVMDLPIANTAGGDYQFAYGGVLGDVPVTGDWTGNGKAKIGVVRQGFLWILDFNGNGVMDLPIANAVGGDYQFAYGGISGDVPVTGDWTGICSTTIPGFSCSGGLSNTKIGIFRQGFLWVLDENGNLTMDLPIANGPGGDYQFAYGGIAGDKPITGKWQQN